MEFLIKEIIKRLEEINAKGGEGNNRQSVALDPDKHNLTFSNCCYGIICNTL